MEKKYVVAKALAATFIENCELDGATEGKQFKGLELEVLFTTIHS